MDLFGFIVSLALLGVAAATDTACPSKSISTLASKLSNYGPAVTYCSSLYPAVYSGGPTDTNPAVTYITFHSTTTETLCASSTFGTSSFFNPFPTGTNTSPSPPPPNPTASQAFSNLTKLPSDCVASVCSAPLGTYTTTYTTSVGVYDITTTYPAAIQTCGPLEYCDLTSANGAPLCRAQPAANQCGPDLSGGPYVPECKSTNGFSGSCFMRAGGGTAGECAGYPSGTPFNLLPYTHYCRSDSDCGSGEFCGNAEPVTFSFDICLKAASELC